MKEREERRRNIVIKGVVVKDVKRKEAVEEMMKVLRVKADMEEVRRLGEERRGGEMLLVKLKGKEQKREIMRRKRELRGRREKIVEDCTW